MNEKINPNEAQMDFFYEDQFIIDNSLQIVEGNQSFKDKKLNPDLAKIMDKNDFEQFQDTVDQVKTYIETKKIKDSYGKEHNDRRIWRKKMSSKYGKPFIEFYQNDKYRSNLVIPVIEWLRTCFESVSYIKDEELKNKLDDALSNLPDYSSYNDMTTIEKDLFLEKVESIATDFLNIVTI